MALQLPALKKLGDELGLSMENDLAAATEGVLDGFGAQEKAEPKPSAG